MARKPKNPITKIRTKNGDGGFTYFGGGNISKSESILDFVGNIDESCAFLGKLNDEGLCDDIIKNSLVILFEMGAMVHSSDALSKYKYRLDDYVVKVENYIDDYIKNNHLVELNGFIIPVNYNADIMIARTVIRRTERSAVVSDLNWAVPVLNCMSDLLFLVAWGKTDIHTKQWSGFEKNDN